MIIYHCDYDWHMALWFLQQRVSHCFFFLSRKWQGGGVNNTIHLSDSDIQTLEQLREENCELKERYLFFASMDLRSFSSFLMFLKYFMVFLSHSNSMVASFFSVDWRRGKRSCRNCSMKKTGVSHLKLRCVPSVLHFLENVGIVLSYTYLRSLEIKLLLIQ